MFTQTGSKPNPVPMWKAVGRLQQCFTRGQCACALGAQFWRDGQAVGNWAIRLSNRCRVRGRWRWGALKMSSVHLVHVSSFPSTMQGACRKCQLDPSYLSLFWLQPLSKMRSGATALSTVHWGVLPSALRLWLSSLRSLTASPGTCRSPWEVAKEEEEEC